jgi:hypothetical protein
VCPKTEKEISFNIPVPGDMENLATNIKKHS